MNSKALLFYLFAILVGSAFPIHASVTLTIVTDPVGAGTVTGAGSYTTGTSASSDITANYGQYISGVSYNPGGTPIQFSVARVLYGDPTLITDLTVSQTLNADTTLTVSFGSLSPAFSVEPTNQSVVTGSTVTFSGAAAGRQPMTYQWQRDDTNIDGATSASLTLTNVQPADVGRYSLIAQNAFGIAHSTPASLAVQDVIVLTNYALIAGHAITVYGSTTVSLQSRFISGWIYYTLDGSTPDFTSTRFTSSFVVGTSCTLRVIAYSADYSQSVTAGPVAITVLPSYYLSAYTRGGGTITLDPPTEPYPSNTTVAVSVAPNPGWTFMGWRGDMSGSTPTNTLVMDGSRAIEALFGTTVATKAVGNGSVSLSPDFPLYPYGCTVTITATPTNGSYFALWGNYGNGTVNPLRYYVSQPTQTVSALFATLPANQITLTTTAEGGGYVDMAWWTNKFNAGDTNLLTAEPYYGQQFQYWTGDVTGTNNPLPVTLTTNMVVTAHFTQTPTLDALAESSQMKLFLGEVSGVVYRLQATTNLTIWTDVAVITNYFGETIYLKEPLDTHVPCRLYRAVAP